MFATDWLQSFLHPERGYKAAGREAEQGWGQAQGFENPYNQAGMNQIGQLQGAENALLNPTELQNKWAASYEMSPYAKQLQEQAKTSGMDAASSQGLLGSSAALSNIQQGASNIMNADRQNYMNDLMEKYKSGIGLGTSMYGTGAQMGGQMGNQAMQAGENRAQMAYGASNAPGEQMKSIINGLLQAYMAKQMGGNA